MSDDYQENSDQIRALSGMNSNDLINHLSNQNGQVNEVAPNMLPHIQQTASRAIQFLGSKLPQKMPGLPEDREAEPSDAEKNRFNTYYKTVDDPMSVLEHVKNGTLNPMHLEALSTVYPDLHQEMKTKVFEHVMKLKADGQTLPYHLRNNVSSFLGQPLDSTQTQPMMAAIMMANAPKAQPQAPMGKQKKVSKSTASTMEKSSQLLQTPSQARAAGRVTG